MAGDLRVTIVYEVPYYKGWEQTYERAGEIRERVEDVIWQEDGGHCKSVKVEELPAPVPRQQVDSQDHLQQSEGSATE